MSNDGGDSDAEDKTNCGYHVAFHFRVHIIQQNLF